MSEGLDLSRTFTPTVLLEPNEVHFENVNFPNPSPTMPISKVDDLDELPTHVSRIAKGPRSSDVDRHLEWMDAPTWPSPVAEGEAGWLVGDDQPLVAPRSAPPVGTSESPWVAHTHGFSVHAGVSINGFDGRGRERLCRYVTRPPYADAQLTETRDGRIAYKLSKPRKTGETHVFFTPNQLVGRLTSQIPPPGQNLLRYHGVLGPAVRRRKEVVRSVPPPRAQRQDGDPEGRACSPPVPLQRTCRGKGS